jgi:6-phosphogluconolactonase
MIRQATLLLTFASSLSALPVFIGTSTGGKSESKGIYLADFNPESGKLSEPKLAAEYQDPGFLAQHPTKPVLLAVGAPNKPFADGTSSVAAFSIAADHSLKFLGEASSGGHGACHLAVDSAGRVVAIANYGDGRIALVGLDQAGVPGKVLNAFANMGKGPNARRQDRSHAHGVYFDPTNQYLFVPDLGLDRVHVYQTGFSSSEFPSVRQPLVTNPGAGPRHMAFSPDEKHAYVINELDGTVLAAKYENGVFEALGTVTTLPADFSGTNTTAEIEVGTDGRFVYASNRGHDSIAVFRRDAESGTLTFVQHAPCGGKTPRHFKISPCGKWLLCGHLDSNTISVLPLDPQTGKLGAATCTVPSPGPICLLFPR